MSPILGRDRLIKGIQLKDSGCLEVLRDFGQVCLVAVHNRSEITFKKCILKWIEKSMTICSDCLKANENLRKEDYRMIKARMPLSCKMADFHFS